MIAGYTCKYSLPCGWCELKKEQCCVNNPITVTPWITPNAVPTEITTAHNDAMKTLAKGVKNE